jgi:hypothetical protein
VSTDAGVAEGVAVVQPLPSPAAAAAALLPEAEAQKDPSQRPYVPNGSGMQQANIRAADKAPAAGGAFVKAAGALAAPNAVGVGAGVASGTAAQVGAAATSAPKPTCAVAQGAAVPGAAKPGSAAAGVRGPSTATKTTQKPAAEGVGSAGAGTSNEVSKTARPPAAAARAAPAAIRKRPIQASEPNVHTERRSDVAYKREIEKLRAQLAERDALVTQLRADLDAQAIETSKVYMLNAALSKVNADQAEFIAEHGKKEVGRMKRPRESDSGGSEDPAAKRQC